MYDNTAQRDYLQAELEYRRNRIKSDIESRRAQRRLKRAEDFGRGSHTEVR